MMRIRGHDENGHELYSYGLRECINYGIGQIPKYAALTLLIIPVLLTRGMGSLRTRMRESKLARV